MTHFKQKFLLFTFVFIFLTSCQQNITQTHKVSATIKKENLFKTIDYFSTNYPYSIPQLENYFHSKLIHQSNNEIYLLTNNDDIKTIDLRKGAEEQFLIIDLKKQPCFDKDKFHRMMLEKHYTFLINSHHPISAYYSKNLIILHNL